MLKELAYRALESRAGRRLVACAGPAVRLPFGEPQPGAPGRALLVVTVDTEGGHVERSEQRVWQGRAPGAFQGYLAGVRHLGTALAAHDAPATFLVAPHGLTARGAVLADVERTLRALPAAGHEVGLHLHPSSDRALAARTGTSWTSGRACDLSVPDLERLVRAGRALLEELYAGTGAALTSFRWGNWALDERAPAVLASAGFTVDSSAVPGLRDARQKHAPRFDWSGERRLDPWTIAEGVLEVPIAMFRVLGRLLRADPLHGSLVAHALRRYARFASAGRPAVFVVMTHSTDATYEDGSPTPVVRALGELLAFAREEPGIEIVTLREAARRWSSGR
ncbi:MAG: polysaccharide deacetylase [Labilithrix sp.]|nr:polysaccharide deacetylase [Labilithrix sp.]